MPYCPSCGTQNAGGAAFCVNCGSNQAPTATASQPNFMPADDGSGEMSPSLMGAFGHCVFQNYANFTGRASRTEYWGFCLGLVAYLVTAVILAVMAGSADSDLAMGVGIIFGIGYLGLLLPMLSCCVRRLHDTGRSGWWYMITFVPYVGSFILLVFTVLPSEHQANQWGGVPRHL